ncbi:hypothetical protein KEM55_009072 [Ascosphaera atra]|nr:hypothetical protein KEM55_009072 [Ascosphaera atra]
MWYHPRAGWRWGFEECGLDVVSLLMNRFWGLISQNQYSKRVLVDETQALNLKRGFPKWRGHQPIRQLPISYARTMSWHYHPFVVKLRSSEMIRELESQGTAEHPKEVQSLKIEMPVECYPFGLSKHNMVVPHIPVSQPSNRPSCICELRKLELVRCCISTGLSDFLDNHARTLRTLILRECFAQSDVTSETSWRQFFQRITNNGENYILSDLQVINDDVCLSLKDVFNHCGSSSDVQLESTTEREENAATSIRKRLANSHQQRRLFSYVMLGSCYLDSMPDYKANMRSFEEALDQRAYDDVQALVRENALSTSVESLCDRFGSSNALRISDQGSSSREAALRHVHHH